MIIAKENLPDITPGYILKTLRAQDTILYKETKTKSKKIKIKSATKDESQQLKGLEKNINTTASGVAFQNNT